MTSTQGTGVIDDKTRLLQHLEHGRHTHCRLVCPVAVSHDRTCGVSIDETSVGYMLRMKVLLVSSTRSRPLPNAPSDTASWKMSEVGRKKWLLPE